MNAYRASGAKVRCVSPVFASLGEGPVWIADESALYWVDILQNAIFRYLPDEARTEISATPFPMTALAPMESGHLLCTGYDALYRLDTYSGELAALSASQIGAHGVRINDGACHRDGAFWFGTMDLDERARVGHFYRVAPDGRRDRIAASFAITNGPAFTADGAHGYFVDTLGRRILRAAMRDGAPGLPFDTFATIADEDGYPDGLAIDAAGGVWCAHWGGARVTRFDAAGAVTDVIRLPVSNVTKCAFGGARLDRLFITTARKGLDEAALAAEPLAGGLFVVDVAYRGIAPARYAGDPPRDKTRCTCFFESP